MLAVVLLLLVACASDDQDPGLQPAEPDPEPELVRMLVLTSAGGEVSPTAYDVDDRTQMRAYVRTFEDRDQATSALRAAVREAGDRGRLVAATVAVGCDVPRDVEVSGADGAPEVRPAKVATPEVECFAPMTSVALVRLP